MLKLVQNQGSTCHNSMMFITASLATTSFRLLLLQNKVFLYFVVVLSQLPGIFRKVQNY